MGLELKRFSEIDLNSEFFESLKSDYAEFSEWYLKKSGNLAYVFYAEEGTIEGFLYLKIEEGAVEDITPPLKSAKRLKVGTFKVNPHGTRLGERFFKKIFDHAAAERVGEIYVTIFPKHDYLIRLFERYGFHLIGTKTTHNGVENVYMRSLTELNEDPVKDYPLIRSNGVRKYVLALYPQFHTRLLPDSILNSETAAIVQDVSHTNSIHKVYLCAMEGVNGLRRGDVLVIYRTSDGAGPAHYRSVATSLCVVEEQIDIRNFASEKEFLAYCKPYSVFTSDELATFWKTKKYPFLIKFTYNAALPRRVNRATLIERVGLSADIRWGFFELSDQQFKRIASLGGVNEGLIVD